MDDVRDELVELLIYASELHRRVVAMREHAPKAVDMPRTNHTSSFIAERDAPNTRISEADHTSRVPRLGGSTRSSADWDDDEQRMQFTRLFDRGHEVSTDDERFHSCGEAEDSASEGCR